MFAVAGVSGNTGSIVAATLLERGQRVRALVRTPEKGEEWKAKGADVAVASLDDPRGLAKALEGAAAAYFLIPPNYAVSNYLEDQKKVADALALAVESVNLPHVVFLSSVGAHLPKGTGPIRALHYGEEKLRAMARSLSILRAPYFMENWRPVVQSARDEGILPSFLSPRRKIPMIATHDIGHMAAECLLDQPKGVRICELSGPQDYSPEDVAAALHERLHRAVKVRKLALNAVVPTFTSMGFSESAARLFEEMYAGLESGFITVEGNGACRPRGLVTLSEAVSKWMDRR